MALWRAAGLCRLALRTQFAAVRLLSSAGAGDDAPSGEDKRRRVDLAALRRERPPRPPGELAQPAQPRNVYSAPKPTYEQLQLNRAITDSSSVDEVLDLVATRSALLDCVRVSTALSVTAKLIGKREPALWLKSDARFRQLMRTALKLMESGAMDAQGFSNMLYACGQLGIAPPPSWLRVYWDANALKLGDFTPQNLSNTLYACGQLGIAPPAGWLQRCWDASALKLGEFKPQDFSNTLYACGQLGITPPADWRERFWDASALKLGEFKPQALSNTLYACGQLSIVPPADWLLRFWHASALKLPQSNPQELSNTLYACAELGITPPADWLLDFARECERALPDMNRQALANTMFALATLALWELPFWPSLWERLCLALSRNIASWSAGDRLDALQLYQAYKAAAVERPSLLPAPSPELLAAARDCWVNQVRYGLDNETSRLHGDVSACLTQMGIAHVNERWCERAERSIDISVDSAVPVAVEVDGPHHFLQDGRQDGRTVLRNRMLAAHGWRVVVVDYRVWQHQLTTEAQREQYLRRLLA